MDPLAEKYYFLSPYAYCSGNPVNFVDWNGEDIWDVHEDGSITWAVFSRIDHVHPNNNPSPSGTGQKNADIGTIFYLDKNGIKFSTPEWDAIFSVKKRRKDECF